MSNAVRFILKLILSQKPMPTKLKFKIIVIIKNITTVY